MASNPRSSADPRIPMPGGTAKPKANNDDDRDDTTQSQRPSSQPPSYNSISIPRDTRIDAEDAGGTATMMDLQNMSARSQWIILALASGACAAFNGVFAKL